MRFRKSVGLNQYSHLNNGIYVYIRIWYNWHKGANHEPSQYLICLSESKHTLPNHENGLVATASGWEGNGSGMT